MRPHPSPAPRRPGFSTVELLVTLGVMGLATALILGTFEAQKRSFEAIELGRTVQEQAREATLELERTLRLAGFGVEPRLAFDFRAYRCAAAPCRDKVNGPDELVFVSRSPRYRVRALGQDGCTTLGGCLEGDVWPVRQVTNTYVKLGVRVGDRSRKGMVLQLICADGSLSTYVTLSTTTAGSPLAMDVEVPILTADATNPFRENSTTIGCLNGGTGLAFVVERQRYFIDPTGNDVPYLMLDTGVDVNGNGQTPDEGDRNDLLPISPGVEDLQVAYVLNRVLNQTAPDSNRNWVVGDAPGVVEEPDPTLQAPAYNALASDPVRATLHPANVRAVRVTLGLRTPRPDPGPPPAWKGDPFFLAENRNAFTEYQPRLRRFRATTTVAVRNLSSRSLFAF